MQEMKQVAMVDKNLTCIQLKLTAILIWTEASSKDCKDMEYDLAKGVPKHLCEPNEMMQGVNIPQ